MDAEYSAPAGLEHLVFLDTRNAADRHVHLPLRDSLPLRGDGNIFQTAFDRRDGDTPVAPARARARRFEPHQVAHIEPDHDAPWILKCGDEYPNPGAARRALRRKAENQRGKTGSFGGAVRPRIP